MEFDPQFRISSTIMRLFLVIYATDENLEAG